MTFPNPAGDTAGRYVCEAGDDMKKSCEDVLSRLEDAGYEAYMVGGCVRDSIMGRNVHDTDITTSAHPEEVTAVFGEENIIPTGIKHGTVTVYKEYEVTTYRIDGSYKDSRRPESVTFTRSLEEDLSRRDFTVNAIAMDIRGSIIDPFGGREDIARKLIRCVGEPEKRFSEDALRILRAVRFASQLGFGIEESTAAAIHSMCGLLRNISHERVREELDKLICGENCVKVLLDFSDVITAVIPEFKPSIGFEQRTPYHRYDVWEHTVRAMAASPAEDMVLRRTLFFHDIGKPACATYDETGRGHFKGHDKAGAEMTGEIMKRLRWDNHTIDTTVTLISVHSEKLKTRADVKRMMSRIGDELFFKLMEMKKCDNLGKNDFVAEENKFFDSLIADGREIVENDECRSLQGLAVSGRDMIAAGLSGEYVGAALAALLEQVIAGALPNEKAVLMDYVRRTFNA